MSDLDAIPDCWFSHSKGQIKSVYIPGEADVLQIFPVKENKKKVMVGGCKCTDGKLHRKNLFQVIRKGETVFKGKSF